MLRISSTTKTIVVSRILRMKKAIELAHYSEDRANEQW